MLFAKANHKNYDAVIEVLNNFCNLASQKVNPGKSKILMFLEGGRGLFVERWV